MIQTYGNSGRPVDADGEVAEGCYADSDDVREGLGDTDTLGADGDGFEAFARQAADRYAGSTGSQSSQVAVLKSSARSSTATISGPGRRRHGLAGNHSVAVAAQAPDALIASVTVVIAVQILVGIITAGIIAARHPGRCGLGGAGKCQGRADCEQCFLEGHNSLPKKCARCNKHRCAKIYFWRLNPV